ncbi:DNA-binding response regulator [Corynebacterium diphtheriae]|nr:DNA-binding response regulator [Corynebacterium diphtheriae]
MITVGLVDDQQLVRAGFRMVLDSQSDITVAWEANDGKEALENSANTPVDVILMDVQMPVMDGLEATKRIVATNTDTRIIVLTTFDSENYVVGAVEHGASGFLLKDTAPEDLIAAVRTVGEQSAVISPAATAVLFKSMRGHAPQTDLVATPGGDINAGLIDPLTPREQEILLLIALGKSNTEIAEELFISLPTVKTHVSKVLSKTGSRDRVHAVLFAFSRGLVAPNQLLTHTQG